MPGPQGAGDDKMNAHRKALQEVPEYTPRRSRDYLKPWEVAPAAAPAAPPDPPRPAASGNPQSAQHPATRPSDDVSPPMARPAKPMHRHVRSPGSDAPSPGRLGATEPRTNAFRDKDLQLALNAAPVSLKVLGMPVEEWSQLDPAAAVALSDELSRKANVFDQMMREHLAEPNAHGVDGRPDLDHLSPEELEKRRAADKAKLIKLEYARRRMRLEEEAAFKFASRIQARVRGRKERAEAEGRTVEREWRFHKFYERSFDSTSRTSYRFMVQAHEKLEIVDASGAGKLLLSAVDGDGVEVIKKGVVYDSSVHIELMRQSPGKGKSRQPAIWAGPGEYEYTFEMAPLAADANKRTEMWAKFRLEQTFTGLDVVSEPEARRSLAYLALDMISAKRAARDSASEKSEASPTSQNGAAMLARADEIARQQAGDDAARQQAVMAQMNMRSAAAVPASPTPSAAGGQGQQAYPYGYSNDPATQQLYAQYVQAGYPPQYAQQYAQYARLYGQAAQAQQASGARPYQLPATPAASPARKGPRIGGFASARRAPPPTKAPGVAGAADDKMDAHAKALQEVPAYTPRRPRDYRKPWEREVAQAPPTPRPLSAASSAPWR